MNFYEKACGIQGRFMQPPRQTPTNGEPDGPLCGNGDLGVVLGGSPERLCWWIGKNDFWRAKDAQHGGGAKPLARLELTVNGLRDAPFQAEQQIGTADILTDMKRDGLRIATHLYAARTENRIVLTLRCLEGETVLGVELTPCPGDGADCRSRIEKNRTVVTKAYTGGELDWEIQACAICRVLGKDGMSFQMKAGEEVTILISAATSFDTEDYAGLAEQLAEEAAPEKLALLRQEHLDWWRGFWNTSGICIPGEPEVERFWYGSHYIMACCCDKRAFAPGIFGNWITTDKANWGGDYHLNYNYQAPWWGVFSSNKVFLADPYDQPLLDSIPKAREHARTLLGCQGILEKVGIGPKGTEPSVMYDENGQIVPEGPFWGQKSNAAYASVNIMMRYYSTYDADYARRAYPFLIATADFWEDYLEFEDGRYVIYNDYVHENPWAFQPERRTAGLDKHHPDNDFNPLLTLGLLRTLFRGLLDISTDLGLDAERRVRWEHILAHLSAFPVQERNGRRVFRYTERGMDWCDSNSLGIQHIFPSGAIGLSSPPALLETARNTLEELNRWEDYNAFPTFFTAAARIGYDPETILAKMNTEFSKHSFPNLFMYYGGGGIECCSAVPSCINDLLLQGYDGILRLFPVWNPLKDASFEHLRTYGAFVVSSAIAGGIVQDTTLFSEKGRECAILSPWEKGMCVQTDGSPVETAVQKASDGTIYRFPTFPGREYRLSCAQ